LKNNFPFRPTINNKEEPKAEHFYVRLQDWMQNQNEKSNK